MATRPSRGKRLTIKEFAATVGVSTATVSRAIHGRGRISPETRARILAQMEQLGYTPEPPCPEPCPPAQPSRCLRVSRRGRSARRQLSWWSWRAASRRGWSAHHYRLLLNSDRRLGSIAAACVCQWVRARVVDGVILVGNPRVDPAWVAALQAEHIPTVWIAYDAPQPLPPHTAVVQLDTSVGWREADRCAGGAGAPRVRLPGSGPARCRPSRPSADALAQHGLRLPDDAPLALAQETPEGGFEAAKRILQQRRPCPPRYWCAPTCWQSARCRRSSSTASASQTTSPSWGTTTCPIARWLVPPLSTIRIDYASVGQRCRGVHAAAAPVSPKSPPPARLHRHALPPAPDNGAPKIFLKEVDSHEKPDSRRSWTAA
jgi:DNA-binding LacI/PurR family transcriptional regulator